MPTKIRFQEGKVPFRMASADTQAVWQVLMNSRRGLRTIHQREVGLPVALFLELLGTISNGKHSFTIHTKLSSPLKRFLLD